MTVSFEGCCNFQHCVPLLGLSNFDTVPVSTLSLKCLEQTLSSCEHAPEVVLVFRIPCLMFQEVLCGISEMCLRSAPLCYYIWLGFLRKVAASLWYDRHSLHMIIMAFLTSGM